MAVRPRRCRFLAPQLVEKKRKKREGKKGGKDHTPPQLKCSLSQKERKRKGRGRGMPASPLAPRARDVAHLFLGKKKRREGTTPTLSLFPPLLKKRKGKGILRSLGNRQLLARRPQKEDSERSIAPLSPFRPGKKGRGKRRERKGESKGNAADHRGLTYALSHAGRKKKKIKIFATSSLPPCSPSIF